MKFELREMDFGMIIDRSIRLFKDNFVPLVLTMAIFYGPFTFIMNVAQQTFIKKLMASDFVQDFWGQIMSGEIPNPEDINFDQLLTEFASVGEFLGIYSILGNILLFLAPLAYLSVYHVMSEYLMGRKASMGEAIRFAGSRYWILLVATILTILLCYVFSCVAGIFGCIVVIIPCLGIIFIVVYIVLLMLFQTMFLSFLPCVVAMEEIGAWASVKRSLRLLKGFWWRSVGIYLLASIIIGVVIMAFSGIGGSIARVFPEQVQIPFTSAISTLFTVISQPIILAVLFLIYIDIRIRKENLDLDILAKRTIGPAKPSQEKITPEPEKTDQDDAWA